MSINPQVYLKLDAIAFSLNHDAYIKQMEGRNTSLKHFTPCDKATIIMAALSDDKTLLLPVLELASLIPCSCHPGFGTNELLDRLPKVQP